MRDAAEGLQEAESDVPRLQQFSVRKDTNLFMCSMLAL